MKSRRALALLLAALFTPFHGVLLGEDQLADPELVTLSVPFDQAPTPQGTMVMDIFEPVQHTGGMLVQPWPNVPGVYEVITSPLGYGGLVTLDEARGTYTAYFEVFGYAPLTLAYNHGNLRFEFDAYGVVGGFQLAEVNVVFSSGAPCPPTLRAGGTVIDGRPGFVASYDTWGFVGPLLEYSWLQFVSMTITYGGTDANGNPWDAKVTAPAVPPGITGWPGNSNGGGTPVVTNPATGRGLLKGDGSQVYVDAPAGDGSYPGQQQAGSATTMTDAPAPPASLPFLVGPPPPDATTQWVKFRSDFWLYLRYDGKAIHLIRWHSEWTFTLANGGLSTNVGVDGGMPVDGLPANHQQALTQHQAGDYSGMPR